MHKDSISCNGLSSVDASVCPVLSVCSLALSAMEPIEGKKLPDMMVLMKIECKVAKVWEAGVV